MEEPLRLSYFAVIYCRK